MSDVKEITIEMLRDPSGHIKTTLAFWNFIFGLVLLVASYFISSMVSSQKATKPERAGLKDFDFPQVEEGTPQIVVFGDSWIEDWTVLWYGNLRTSDIKSEGQSKK